MQARLQLGPTESCMTRDTSKPLVQIMHIHTPSLQSGSPAVARQLARSHIAYWLAASGFSLCPGEQTVINYPRFRERFLACALWEKASGRATSSLPRVLLIFLSPNTDFGELKGRCLKKKHTFWSFPLSFCSLPKHKDVWVYVHVKGGK